ncbi:MAG: hypothetical protein WC783_00935 [Candidatus Paceibacterota bacterium]|jgi:hypothetical protein
MSKIDLDKTWDKYLQEAGSEDTDLFKEFPDIVTFLEADWGIKQHLHPVEKFVLKEFYNIPLNDYDRDINLRDYPDEKIVYSFTEAEFEVFLHERKQLSKSPDFNPEMAYQELVVLAGRRSMKTFLTSCIDSYEVAKLIHKENPQGYYGLPENEEIKFVNVATRGRQSKILYRAIVNMINRPFFNKYRYKEKATNENAIKLYTAYDLKCLKEGKRVLPSITVTSDACTASGSRGEGNLIVALDEIAHFKSNEGNQSDSEVYNAISPSISTFNEDGKLILITSPLGEFGVAFEHFMGAFKELGEPGGTISFRLPTWWCNPKITMSYLTKAEKRKPDSFLSEYGAELIGGKGSAIEKIEKLTTAMSTALTYRTRGLPEIRYYLALDAGYANDTFAAAIVHLDGTMSVLDALFGWKAGEGDFMDLNILNPKEIAPKILEIYKSFRIVSAICDQWESYGLLAELSMLGITNITRISFNRQLNSEVNRKFLSELYSGNIIMPNDISFKSELLSLRKELLAGHELRIEAPPGKHDDRYSATSRAIFHAFEKENPITGRAFVANTAKVSRGYGATVSKNRTNTQLYRSFKK